MGYRSLTELVQFKLTYFEIGDILVREEKEDFFDHDLITGLDDGEELLDILEKQEDKTPEGHWRPTGEKFLVKKPFVHFYPRKYLSDSADYVGAEDDVNHIGVDEVFKDSLPEILTLAKKFGYSYGKREIGNYEGQKTQAVVTVWKYNSWGGSSYYGENDDYDSECYLVGAMNMCDIDKILLKSTDEPKKFGTDAKEILELG